MATALKWSARAGGFVADLGRYGFSSIVATPTRDLKGVTLHASGRHFGNLLADVQDKELGDKDLLNLAVEAEDAARMLRSESRRYGNAEAADYYEDLWKFLMAVGDALGRSMTRKITNPAVLSRGGFRAVSPGRHVVSPGAARPWPPLRKNRGPMRETFSVRRKADGAAAYEQWHWGIAPTLKLTVNDPRLPDILVECGRMYQITYDPPKGSAQVITNQRGSEAYENSHLCFDPTDRWGQLYIVCSPALKARGKKLWSESEHHAQDLKAVAKMADNGKHTNGAYPRVKVKPLGLLTDLVYGTNKKGDGKSLYHHEVGEETGVLPVLCVAQDGTFWIAGGDYHGSNTAGITN